MVRSPGKSANIPPADLPGGMELQELVGTFGSQATRTRKAGIIGHDGIKAGLQRGRCQYSIATPDGRISHQLDRTPSDSFVE